MEKTRQPVRTVTATRTEETTLPSDSGPGDLEGRLEESGLSSLEEKVIRMRHGLVLDDERPLGQKTTDPQLLQQLAEIELAAFRRLTQPRSDDPKERILSRLQRQR